MTITTTYEITIVTTGKGADSSVPDNDRAIDADVFADGEHIGSVTLLPNDRGDHDTWGAPENWSDDALRGWANDHGVELGNLADAIVTIVNGDMDAGCEVDGETPERPHHDFIIDPYAPDHLCTELRSIPVNSEAEILFAAHYLHEVEEDDGAVIHRLPMTIDGPAWTDESIPALRLKVIPGELPQPECVDARSGDGDAIDVVLVWGGERFHARVFDHEGAIVLSRGTPMDQWAGEALRGLCEPCEITTPTLAPLVVASVREYAEKFGVK